MRIDFLGVATCVQRTCLGIPRAWCHGCHAPCWFAVKCSAKHVAYINIYIYYKGMVMIVIKELLIIVNWILIKNINNYIHITWSIWTGFLDRSTRGFPKPPSLVEELLSKELRRNRSPVSASILASWKIDWWMYVNVFNDLMLHTLMPSLP